MNCFRCEDCGWVCENHDERPWEGSHVCGVVTPACPVQPATRSTKGSYRGSHPVSLSLRPGTPRNHSTFHCQCEVRMSIWTEEDRKTLVTMLAVGASPERVAVRLKRRVDGS
jgi:hypothetical protein